MSLAALIFDVDGTLAETEEAHRAAFNQVFAEAGEAWFWSVDEYRDLLRVTGGQRRLRHYFRQIGVDVDDERVAALHGRKNAVYAALVADGAVALRPGVARLIGEARAAGVTLAVATTTSRANLDALLATLLGAEATGWFAAIVAGEDVARTKPDPEAYALALAALGLETAACVAVEDSRNGLDAALAAGLATLVTPSLYTAHEDFAGAALVCADLDHPPVDLARVAALLSAAAPRASADARAGRSR